MHVMRVWGGNIYDILHPNGTGKTSYATEFLREPSTKRALGVEVTRQYEKCNIAEYDDFIVADDWTSPASLRVVPGILAQIAMLIYAGDLDYICNWLGNLAWVRALDWPVPVGFQICKNG
ncbi:hypothetical protein E4U58_003710 [Claviceps cyperi]|nr:hypothetical protein E4U58_003710 [Claviceps cyperi]